MNIQQLLKKYPDKSIPEFVELTYLATANSRIVGCEGITAQKYNLCKDCPIGGRCYFKLYWIFQGGRL